MFFISEYIKFYIIIILEIILLLFFLELFKFRNIINVS